MFLFNLMYSGGGGSTLFALFGGGSSGSGTGYTDKYVYNNDVVVAGNVLGLARYGSAASSSSPGGF